MPVLGESEKARLQRIFEWSNRGSSTGLPQRDSTPKPAAANNNDEAQVIRKHLLGEGALRKQKRWLDILADEVVVRETALKVMRAERQEHLSKDQLRHEIEARIKRMKEIQNHIARQERLQKQTQMAELVDQSMSKSCHATYNAQRVQREKKQSKNNNKNNNNEGNHVGGLSSHSKRLLEHNLNTASTEKPPAAAATNHRRYKHSGHNTFNIPPSFLWDPKGSNNAPHLNPSFFFPPKGSSGIKQSKENHHHHHHDQENHHHRHHVEKRQVRDLKTSRHHRTSCTSESERKTKSTSRF